MNNPDEEDLSEASMDIEDEEEDALPAPPLPPPTQPSTEQNIARQAQAIKTTSVAVAKQSAIKAAVLRQVQVNPVEPASDPIAAAHSPPSSPAQQSPSKKARQTHVRSHARK